MTKNKDFREESNALTLREAIDEAKRCLNCKVPSCRNGCPIEHEIPQWIHALSKGNIGEAKSIIDTRSNLPAVCGRVCPHELQCEGHCILAKQNKPIRIGKLERFIADTASEMNLFQDKITAKTKGKVSVIGSGPAGLTVAGDLSKRGFIVTVYEALPLPGGILMYGIPEFRLPKEVIHREVKQMEAQGVRFVTNTVIGKDITLDELIAKNEDAIFIGTGTAIARDLDFEGKDLIGIVQSFYFLQAVQLYSDQMIERKDIPLSENEEVLVIGGGNVAIDAARTAQRMGAKVKIVYRGTREKMPAIPSEYEKAMEDGIEFLWQHAITGYVGENGKISGITVDTPDGKKILHANKVFLAIGSRPANRLVSSTSGIDVDENGYVITKQRPYGMTSKKGVFAGGDVVHRPATVVLAMKEARKVAESISAYIDAIKLLE